MAGAPRSAPTRHRASRPTTGPWRTPAATSTGRPSLASEAEAAAAAADAEVEADVGRPNLQVSPVSKIPTDVEARTDGSSRQEARMDVGY